jgi:hypothetical protein
MTTQPIFVVGVPRSGTTLLAAMLAAHSRLSCGPETHFFTRGSGLGRLKRAWPETALDYLFSLVPNIPGSRPVPEQFGISRDVAAAFLRERPPSVHAVLASLTEQHMRKLGKERWVEKTPRHLVHLPRLRRYFPDAPVLRIVRDPRDTALSIFKAPWKFRSYLEALLFWHYLDARGARYVAADPHCYTVRYEDLLASPEEELRKICAYIGETFEPGMLNTAASAAEVNRGGRSWLTKVGTAIDRSRAGVWHRELTAEQQMQAEAVLGDRLTAYGYPSAGRLDRYVTIFPMHALANYPPVVSYAVSQGVRFWPVGDEKPELKLFLGHPEVDDWLGINRWARLGNAVSVAADIVRVRLRGKPWAWLWDPSYDPSGYCSSLLAWLLRRGAPAANGWRCGARQPTNLWL